MTDMELPGEATVPGALPPGRGRSAVGEWTIVVTIICSLVLAAGAGYVFYASIWPVSIDEGYGSVFLDWPWLLAYLVLLAVWAAGPVALLVLGLIHLFRHARHRWRSAACWLVMLAAGAAVGFLIIRDYRLLFSAYPADPFSGEALGPSRWAPGGPYWPALVAAGGELAVAAVLIALVDVLPPSDLRKWLSAGVRAQRQRSSRFAVYPPARRGQPTTTGGYGTQGGASASTTCISRQAEDALRRELQPGEQVAGSAEVASNPSRRGVAAWLALVIALMTAISLVGLFGTLPDPPGGWFAVTLLPLAGFLLRRPVLVAVTGQRLICLRLSRFRREPRQLAFAVPLAQVRIVAYRPRKYTSSIRCEIPGHNRIRLDAGPAGRKDFATVEEALARSGAFAELDPPWPPTPIS
jgi:hypothetical protein